MRIQESKQNVSGKVNSGPPTEYKAPPQRALCNNIVATALCVWSFLRTVARITAWSLLS